LRNAWDVLGTLQLEIAEKCELPAETPVLCGIHALGARYARYLAAGLDDFTLLSRGRWLIAWNTAMPLADLDPLRNTIANVDLLGRPVACARFMAAREQDLIAGKDGRAVAGIADVEALIAAGTVALPCFSDCGGPYPESRGRGLIAGPMPEDARAKAALASLYGALMTRAMLDLLRSGNRLILEGGRAEDLLLGRLLAALRPEQPVAYVREADGAALGAALLWGWQDRREPVPLDLEPIAAPEIAGLADYAQRWRAWATPVAAL
jgi:sugar (pentulose or hexulose) kinase